MQKARRQSTWDLRPFVGARFQVLFHPLTQGTFHLSFTVLVHYRSLGSIQPYRMVPADSKGISPVPPYSGYYYNIINLPLQGSHLLRPAFPDSSCSFNVSISQSYNPSLAATTLVWANPRSLATTYGITFVFFSSAYLDVSVQRVCPPIGVLSLQDSGLPHSGIYGSIRVCQSPQLFAAYHAFHRL